MKKNMVIVGAGISGLTAAAYLSHEGHSITLLEKSDDLGGLVGSFNRDGFVFVSWHSRCRKLQARFFRC